MGKYSRDFVPSISCLYFIEHLAHSQLGGGGITERLEKESGGWKLRVLGLEPS